MDAFIASLPPVVQTLVHSRYVQVAALVLALALPFKNKFGVGFAYLVTHYRPVFVMFLLPMSLLFDIFWYVRSRFNDLRANAPELHGRRVKAVCDQVAAWDKDGRQAHMCTSRPGWLTTSIRVPVYKDKLRNIDVNLKDIVSIDTEKRLVRVEPQCTMGQITNALIPLGWTLQIVPELDDLTVGGLINGFGVETSSFRYGLFQHICEGFEIVLPDGSAVWATASENPDLFATIPWSHGTLGFLVAADIRIIPCQPYVKVEYTPAHSKAEIVRLTQEASRRITDDSVDFVETLMYSDETGVLMCGKMVPFDASVELNAIGRSHKPWFFKHVETMLTTGKKTELIPLRDYYHRHTRSIFWEIQDIIPFGNHPLFRYTLGWMTPPKVALLKATMTAELKRLYTEKHCIQDMLVPIKSLSKSLSVFEEELQLYPLWLCPMRIIGNNNVDLGASSGPRTRGSVKKEEKSGAPRAFLNPLADDDMFIDIGAYGNPKPKDWNARDSLRRIEEHVRQTKGFQALYADTYMTKEEFRQMFDHSLYDKVRARYGCEAAFPDVYDKVSMKARK